MHPTYGIDYAIDCSPSWSARYANSETSASFYEHFLTLTVYHWQVYVTRLRTF